MHHHYMTTDAESQPTFTCTASPDHTDGSAS